MRRMIEAAAAVLAEGRDLAAATIVDSEGSTPRRAGSKMFVNARGEIWGTIGGGVVEAEAIAEAVRVIGSGAPQVRDFDLTHQDVAGAGMICGGHLRVALDPWPADAFHRQLAAALAEALGAGRRVALITGIAWTDPPQSVGRWLIELEGDLIAGVGPPPEAAADWAAQAWKSRAPVLADQNQTGYLVEPGFSEGTVHIMGAGHVSLATAQVARLAGFRVQVVDDRAEFAHPDRFPHAESVAAVDDFENALAGRDLGPDDYVVIVTRGHRHDKEVLAQALKTKAGYIGMIGSSRKRRAIYEALLAEGFTQNDLDRVYSPIGLSIGAQTPEEIGISIVAQLVQVRAGA